MAATSSWRCSGGSYISLRRLAFQAEALLDVILDDDLEFARDAFAAQGHRLGAVDEHRRRRRLAGAGQGNADVGVLALARPVDDAAHHRDVETLDAGIAALPLRHR